MKPNILLLIASVFILWMASPAQALDDRPAWKVLVDELAYLRGVPEVAWVKAHGHRVFISWTTQPGNFGRININAARRAAHALHDEVTVYSLPAGEELPADIYGYEPSALCETVANPHEIVKTNCR